jgi:ATP-dependent RNA helicase RhlE
MGFQRDINKIMGLMPKKRQNLLFSATFSKEIKSLARGILNNPILIETSTENTTVEAIFQYVYKVDKNKKSELIIQLIKQGNWQQVLVFTRTKHGANNLCKKMIKANISAAAIHGNKSQGARTKALAGFKNGIVQILVATDIAARGLDIPLLPHVINFELPNIPEDYVHRIGRTGRAGANGEAISLVCIDEKEYLRDIEKLIGLKIPSKVKAGFEPNPNAVPEPKKKKNNFNRKQGNSNQSRNRSRNNR